jgi:SLT domain-containing protein
MQTIPPTFQAYKQKGMNDIFNPVHNAAAAINYIKARYGTVFNTPGIKSMSKGGPYKGYYKGGIVENKQLAWIAEKGAEAVIPLRNNRERAQKLWEKTGREIGGFDNVQGDQSEVVKQLVKANEFMQEQIALLTALVTKDTNLVMDGREVGRLVEPHVTKFQESKKGIGNLFGR